MAQALPRELTLPATEPEPAAESERAGQDRAPDRHGEDN
jgi:hypothetical protein